MVANHDFALNKAFLNPSFGAFFEFFSRGNPKIPMIIKFWPTIDHFDPRVLTNNNGTRLRILATKLLSTRMGVSQNEETHHKNYEPMVYYYNQPFPKNKYWRPVSLLTLDHQRKCLTARNKRPWIQETTLDPFTQLKVHPGATDAIIWGKVEVMMKALGWWNWKYPSFPVLVITRMTLLNA